MRKMRTRKTPNTDTFYAVMKKLLNGNKIHNYTYDNNIFATKWGKTWRAAQATATLFLSVFK